MTGKNSFSNSQGAADVSSESDGKLLRENELSTDEVLSVLEHEQKLTRAHMALAKWEFRAKRKTYMGLKRKHDELEEQINAIKQGQLCLGDEAS